MTEGEFAGSLALVAGLSFQSFPAEDFRREPAPLQQGGISPRANRKGQVFSRPAGLGGINQPAGFSVKEAIGAVWRILCLAAVTAGDSFGESELGE